MKTRNPVLSSIQPVVMKSKHVSIDVNKAKEVARRYSEEKLILPDWTDPVFPEATNAATLDFIFLGNSINFAYSHVDTKKEFEVNYNGVNWNSAFGMWASLKRAVEDDIPILDVKYLSKINRDEMENIFRSTDDSTSMPMLKERLGIFREIGQNLDKFYGSHFSNLLDKAQGTFNDQNTGVVNKILTYFPSFRDSWRYGNITAIFNKRAQLAAAMAYERFLPTGQELFTMADVSQFTIFADYELPKVLRSLGVIKYTEDLGTRVDKQIPIIKGSPEELEIRANTVYAGKLIQDTINEARKSADRVNALHIDFKLWSEGINSKESKHHLTETTAY